MTTDIDKALEFVAPARDEVEQSLGLLRRYFSPECIGLQNIDRSRPTLFVGNHTRFGLLDVPLMTRGIYLETGIYPRGLADHVHYKIPYWREFLGRNGAVVGTRDMCSAMMKAGESLLVFPGGAREVGRGRGKNYQLMWENRLGFARMAIEHGYSITPFCSVGPDEVFDVVVDGDDIMNSSFGKLMRKLSGDSRVNLEKYLFPIPRGVGLSMVPRPEKFYFAFGKPIETKSHKGLAGDVKRQRRVQKQAAEAIEHLLAETMLHREQTGSDQSIWRKLLQRT